MRANSESGGAARFALGLAGSLALLLLLGVLTARYALVELPAEVARRAGDQAVRTAREIAAEVAQALQAQPKVTVNNRTIVEQDSEVLQLVALERTVTRRLRLDNSWLHSTKTLEVEADFAERAGFDLSKPFVIDVSQAGAALRVALPPAEILSVEMKDVRFLRDEDGLWNKLTAEDREAALRELKRTVAIEARKSGLAQQARALAERRLAALLSGGGRTVTFDPEAKH